MKDKDFLQWLHDRIVNVYEEDKNIDFMWKLRSIIANYDPDKITPNTSVD